MTPNSGPHMPTVSIATSMILLGAAVYLLSGMDSVTALIPSFVGVPILLLGLLAAKAHTFALIVALVLAVLGFLAPLGRIVPLAMKGELGLSVAFAGQVLFVCLAAILTVILIGALRRSAS